MTREEFEALVFDAYGVRADYPFEDDFETGVFRHESGKWFALAMKISERKLGKCSDMTTNVVNFKCAPEVIESIAGIEPGIYRAYHMNKTHWVTISLDGKCDDEKIKLFIDMSFSLTGEKRRRKSEEKHP